MTDRLQTVYPLNQPFEEGEGVGDKITVIKENGKTQCKAKRKGKL